MNEEDKSGKLSFEDRLIQVQELTGKIESGSLTLEDSMKEFERGMKILSGLSSELNEMQRRLTLLQNGKETEIPDENNE